ncbi:DNA-binding domain-containing protein [Paracoccus tegillarcae]|uniref:DUF2063 domain-containing protein n=1 Tax=Paracoccus tegillarcae TaxID=1529068 RepID=A0A2K9EDD5_9RHOB|nr:putative DNA-binding domain-containing protein [Paracoccus tegillarcae]AUH32958.1 DUF2063 domain-containing protein [Paracoccus tegillarcae]
MPLPVEDTHHGFADDFRRALTADHLPRGVTAATDGGLAPNRAALAARFAVYRNNVMHSLSRALARRFPVIERLVGAEFFAAMAVEFIHAHPPRSPVLIAWGGEFPGFLQGFPPVASLPYLPDVARLEYARGQAYHAADIKPMDSAALAACGQPDRLSLTLAPGTRLLCFDHPAVTIWQANQPGGNPSTRAEGPEKALIYRRPDFQVPVRSVSDDTAAFLAAVIGGDSLADAATHVVDPTPMLTLLISEGLIAAADIKEQQK